MISFSGRKEFLSFKVQPFLTHCTGCLKVLIFSLHYCCKQQLLLCSVVDSELKNTELYQFVLTLKVVYLALVAIPSCSFVIAFYMCPSISIYHVPSDASDHH